MMGWKTIKKRSVGTAGIPAPHMSVLVGFVIIPSIIDRAEYIKNVYKNNTINVRTEDGNILRNVLVARGVIQDIEFPLDTKDVGSLVILNNVPKHNKLVVVGVLDVKQSINKITAERQFRLQKIGNDGYVDIGGDADGKRINISVNSEVSGEGEINMNIINPDDTAVFNLFVKGFINIQATEDVQIIAGNNVIEMTDAGIRISAGDGQQVWVNGSFDALFSKIPNAGAITDLSQIGISSSVRIGE